MTQDQSKSGHFRAADIFLLDIRHGIRALSKAPLFTAAAVMGLAIGIGAGAAIFSVVNAVLLRSLPYPDPNRVVVFATSSPTIEREMAASPVEFNFWREQATGCQDICAYRLGRISMTNVDQPEQLRSAFVTSGYFRLFGAKAAFGRTFTAEEDRPGGGDVVVLSAEFWKRGFGGDPQVIGKEIFLGGKPYRIVGIMAPTLEVPALDSDDGRGPVDVWMPFEINDRSTDTNGYFTAAARLRPGVSLRSLLTQLRLATTQFRRRFPWAGLHPQAFFTAVEIRAALVGDRRSYFSVLSGAVALLLLIACVNVATLSLAHGAGRRHEIAIRAALGAGRSRIGRQLLTESVLLSAAGGALGLTLGIPGIRALLALNTVSLPRIGDHGSAGKLPRISARISCEPRWLGLSARRETQLRSGLRFKKS